MAGMGEFLPPVIMELRASIGEFSAKMAEAKGELRSLEAEGGRAGQGFAAALSKGVLLGAAALAAGAAIAVHEGMKLEDAQVRLRTALEAQKAPVEEIMSAVEGLSSKYAQLGFSSTDVTDAFGKLELATQNPARSMKLLGLAADYARFRHISLSDSARLIARGTQGAARALKELGITLDKSIKDPSLRAANGLYRLQERLSGQSAAYAKTFGGQMHALGAQVTNVAEKIGVKLLPYLLKMVTYINQNLPVWSGWIAKLKPAADFLGAVARGLADVAGWAIRNQAALKPLVLIIGTFIGVMKVANAVQFAYRAAMQAYAFWTYSDAAANGVLATSWEVLNAVMMANPIGLIIAAVAALVVGLIYAYKHSEKFRQVIHVAFTAVKKIALDVLDFFKTHWKLILAFMTGPIGLAIYFIISHFKQIKDLGTKAFQWGKDIINGLVRGIRSAIGAVTGAVKSVADTVVKTFKNVLGISSPSKVMAEHGDNFNQGLANGINRTKAVPSAAARALAQDISDTYKAAAIANQGYNNYRTGERGGSTGDSAAAVISAGSGSGSGAGSGSGGGTSSADRKKALLDAAKQQVKDAKDALIQARSDFGSYKSGISSSYQPDIMNTPAGTSPAVGLKLMVYRLKEFAKVVKALARKGLNNTMLQQVIAAGPDALPMAREILASNIGSLNSLQHEVETISSSIGDVGAKSAGLTGNIAKAKGKVAAAESKEKALEVTVNVHLDGKQIHKSVQHQSLKHNRRNVANNLTIPKGAFL